MQGYLNGTEHLWGLVTNGRRLRLLRDSSRTARPTYVEFDLEGMLEGERFADFALFYRLLHRSRLPLGSDDAPTSLLEQYHQEALAAGGRVREGLREGVETALREFGEGLLRHPANEALRERLAEGTLTPLGYYRQLLRLVYRLLFLMVAEERNLLGGTEEGRRRYLDWYSVSRLRRVAERSAPSGEARYGDLWQGLLATFGALEGDGGARALGVAPLDGDLFGEMATRALNGTQLDNGALRRALRALSLYRDSETKALRRVNYGALDVEELGSVYESLLDYRPVVRTPPGDPYPTFELVTGTERKTTGSYYTHPDLVQELIRSALEPVLEARLQAAGGDAKAQEAALLAIKVCDPACGSGHFLLAAARRLSQELARIRSGEAEPTPENFRAAARTVIAHCIYGVDLNPLAVDLCKLALWIEGHAEGMPLSFLDSHIRWGNALVGATRAQVDAGIPDDAYKPVTGDDKGVAQALRAGNRSQRRRLEAGQLLFDLFAGQRLADIAEEARRVDAAPDHTVAAVREKAQRYEALHRPGSGLWDEAVLHHLWTAAFFLPLTEGGRERVMTTADLVRYVQTHSTPKQMDAAAISLAQRLGFFHWHLEFPQIFGADGSGGFDVVLGNPPWEMLQLEEKQFFAGRAPEIAEAPNKAARERLIKNLPKTNAALAEEFAEAAHTQDALNRFIRASARYPLTAVGKLNTYSLFSELARSLVARDGRAGIIVPTGIATDDGNKYFFDELTSSNRVASLFDFENREAIFAGVHRSYKFSLLTLGQATERPQYTFFATNVAHLRDPQRRFTLTGEEIALLNPNTRTVPVFRTCVDAELTKKIYARVPVLENERTGANPWGIRFMTMFNMASDSRLFHSDPGDGRVPLYEAKLLHQFTHRWATYQPDGSSRQLTEEELRDPHCAVTPRYWVEQRRVNAKVAQVPDEVKQAYLSRSEKMASRALAMWLAGWHLNHGSEEVAGGLLNRIYGLPNSAEEVFFNWMHTKIMEEKFPLTDYDRALIQQGASLLEMIDALVKAHCPGWLLGFRDIARATDERTAIFTLLPRVGVGHTAPLMFIGEDPTPAHIACLLAVANSLTFDYATRQMLGGTHLTHTVLRQLPVLPPDAFSEEDRAFIVPRVLELVYTAWDMEPFARDLEPKGLINPSALPYRWDEERRALLRAELDARIARLYGLTRDELRYILDPADVYGDDFPGETFRVLKQKEQRQYGEYRTRRLVLEAWGREAEERENGGVQSAK